MKKYIILYIIFFTTKEIRQNFIVTSFVTMSVITIIIVKVRSHLYNGDASSPACKILLRENYAPAAMRYYFASGIFHLSLS